MKIKPLLALPAAILLTHCSPDNDGGSASTAVKIAKYIVTETTLYSNPPDHLSHYISTGILFDGRLESIESEIISNGLSYGADITQIHFYENGNLVTEADEFPKHYFYDANGVLVGADIDSQRFYRVVYPAADTVYLEMVTEPYDSPTAEIVARRIGILDEEDNVVTAGRDQNLDGVIDNPVHFTWVAGDLVSAEFANGTTRTWQYSTIKNPFTKLYDDSFGRRTRRILQLDALDADSMAALSVHITAEEAAGGVFEMGPDGYYAKKTETPPAGSPNVVSYSLVTEFFFE